MTASSKSPRSRGKLFLRTGPVPLAGARAVVVIAAFQILKKQLFRLENGFRTAA